MQLTQESILAARQQIADNAQAVIGEAIRVNDLPGYIRQMQERAELALSGQFDHTLSFRQLAYYLQTGDCPALLP